MTAVNWPSTAFSETCDLLPGFAFNSSRFTDDDVDIALIKGENLGKGEILWDKSKYWPRTDARDYEKFQLKADDVLLAMDRPIVGGRLKYAWIQRDDPPAFLVQRVARLRGINSLHTCYLRYLIGSPSFLKYIDTIITGANVPHISGRDILKLAFLLPPESVQLRVVDILVAYDNLIENNRRRIALLEEAAQQLYKEWFVHLRFPGHEHTKIVDGVPEGWERSVVGHLFTSLEDGDWIESKDQGGTDYRLLQISNIGVNSFVETNNYRFITEETFRSLRCQEVTAGDILISRMPKPIGRAWLVADMPWKMVTAVDVAIGKPDPHCTSTAFVIEYLNSPGNFENCEVRASGTTRPRITRKNLAGIPLLMPTKQTQDEYAKAVDPMLELIGNLRRQNQGLVEARELLLPRLMCGEIEV